jgi:hypothetical protein
MSLIAVLAGFSAACGGSADPGDDGGDDSGDDSSSASCRATVDDYSAIAAALDRSCVTVADCELLWDNTERFPDCDCLPFLTDQCEGYPVARAAITPAIRAQLDALQTQFHEVCPGVTDVGTCDCAPQDMFCSESGFCSLTTDNVCFGPPPDAPPPDASPDAEGAGT